MEAAMRAVIFSFFLSFGFPAFGYAPQDIWETSEDIYLGFEVIFLDEIPKPNGVYRVIFSTYDEKSRRCQVEIRSVPDQTAVQYDGAVEFLTDVYSVIFPPNSDHPMDVVEFELTTACDEFEDMTVPVRTKD